jgi:hypothetical protein
MQINVKTCTAAIESLLSQPIDYAEVETGTAARAAKLIAEVL